MADTPRARKASAPFPRSCARNAQTFGDTPAYREKEFGIWQSWTWAETERRDRGAGARAAGPRAGGRRLRRHHRAQPPALYWAMVAAQMAARCRCRSTRTRWPKRWPMCSDHCGARFVVAGDQEQVDKVIEIQDRAAPVRTHDLCRHRAGMRKYDHARLHDYARRPGRRAAPRATNAGAELDAAQREADLRRHLRDALHLRHDGQAQGRGPVEPQHHRERPRLVRIRPPAPRATRCWPTCRWPGSATSSFPSGRPTGPGSA